MKMRPLLIGQSEAETLRLMGTTAMLGLMDDAAAKDCPDDIRDDWHTIAKWMNYSGGEWSAEQSTQVSKAWGAYLAIGLAPSFELQKSFDHMAERLKNDPPPRPPKEIMDVFDRLLATDDQIKAKRTSDVQRERARLEQTFKALRSTRVNWWRELDPATRIWIFASAVWMAAVFSYGYVFDPFDTGGWDSMGDEEFNRLAIVACLPIFGGFIYRAYWKWVV